MTDAALHAPEKKAAEKPRRVRREPEVARKLILDAAEQVMRDEGYTAVSTRRVAKDAGLAPALGGPTGDAAPTRQWGCARRAYDADRRCKHHAGKRERVDVLAGRANRHG